MGDGDRRFHVVRLLQDRQVLSPSTPAFERRIASGLCTRSVHLAKIASLQLLQHSHVVLGFSRCGQLLLSYCSELDDTATHSTYTLYCWLFSGQSPLKYVSQEPLFRGESVPADLHLVVCQTPQPTSTVVIGCRYRKSCVDDYSRPCYVTVLPSFPPSTMEYQCSFHFKFDLMPPFPSFTPSLSLKIENCVLVNRADSIVALHYSLPSSTNTDCQSIHTKKGSSSGTKVYPASEIHVYVYCGDQLVQDDAPQIPMRQVSLDVELWVSEELQSELAAAYGVTYHSLTDYDLQVAEVCASSSCAVLILVALLEASLHSTSCRGTYSVEVKASWNMLTGSIEWFEVSKFSASLTSGTRWWNPAAPVALSYRQQYSLLRSTDMSVRTLSNHTVFSGKSLQFLKHPFLPISLTLLSSAHH